MKLTAAEESGVYARKQLLSRARLIAWSHRRRFQVALDLAARVGGSRVLDYGSGDGSFIAMLRRGAHPPPYAAGVEIAPDLVDDCRRRLGYTGAVFVHVDELGTPAAAFDTIYCMEVLEHVVDRRPLLERLKHMLAPGGHLIVSVPVETGVPLVLKQVVRTIAGWRGIGDYPGTDPSDGPSGVRASSPAPGSTSTARLTGQRRGRPSTITRASTGWCCATTSRGCSCWRRFSPRRYRLCLRTFGTQAWFVARRPTTP